MRNDVCESARGPKLGSAGIGICPRDCHLDGGQPVSPSYADFATNEHRQPASYSEAHIDAFGLGLLAVAIERVSSSIETCRDGVLDFAFDRLGGCVDIVGEDEFHQALPFQADRIETVAGLDQTAVLDQTKVT